MPSSKQFSDEIREVIDQAKEVNPAPLRDFLERIEPHIHGIVARHAPGFKDDGLVSRFSYPDTMHKLIQTKPDHRGFWEECLGCTAKQLLEEG